jgi:uncharacterized sulfatase
MYEESLRMPLLMQLPGTIPPGSRIDAMVQNLDFAQTFLDFAGGSSYATDMQGRSFRKLLEESGSGEDFRDAIYYHYYDFPAFHMVKKHYGIRTRRYKLMHFYDDIDAWEFYDLETDPQELHNAIDDPAYAGEVTLLKSRLLELQRLYGVTEKEFEQAPKASVDRAYEQFRKLRGN